MGRVWKGKVLRPKLNSPVGCEILGSRLARELSAGGLGAGIHDLKMSQLMQEDVINQEAPDRYLRPLSAPTCTELFASLPPGEKAGEAHARGQGAQADLTTSASARETQNSRPAASVIEVDPLEPIPRLAREAHQDHPDVPLANVVDSVTARSYHVEAQLSKLRVSSFHPVVHGIDRVLWRGDAQSWSFHSRVARAYHSVWDAPEASIRNSWRSPPYAREQWEA